MASTAWSGDTVYVAGSIQHDGLFPTADVSATRAVPRPSWAKIDHLSNSYLDLSLRYEYNDSNAVGFRGLTLDTRAELTQWPLLGYEAEISGHGIGRLSAGLDFNWGQITFGDVYAQFGSGLVLNLNEDRALGVDNPLRGAKIQVAPYKGIELTLLGGKQRRYWNSYKDGAWGWNYKQDAALGANLELDFQQWSPRMQEADVELTLGGSYVSKYEQDETLYTIIDNQLYRYNLPHWVGAGDVRAELQYKGFDFLAEYAYKANDPCADNNYSYNPGQALLLSFSYSRKGMSILAQVKRSENMSFRSERSRRGLAGRLNYLPAFTQQHTYALPALYPYATQYVAGEWSFQGEIRYTWPRKTKMGGRYGTTLKLGGSHVRGLKEEGSWRVNTTAEGAYYTDVNIELNKRITQRWRLNAMLMYQTYNQQVVEGHGSLIRSGIAVLDSHVEITENISLRNELQYLYTPHHEGQWIFALAELSLWNCVTISGQYTYNIGHAPEAINEHFYTAEVTYTNGAHRLMVGYTKTQAGFHCSGGICRYVPEQEGVTMSYSFTW